MKCNGPDMAAGAGVGPEDRASMVSLVSRWWVSERLGSSSLIYAFDSLVKHRLTGYGFAG